MITNRHVAEAFSRHRFAEAYDHLADDIRWVLAGTTTLAGKQVVVDACEGTARDLVNVTTDFDRFLVLEDADRVVIDVIARYTGPDGSVSTVSSCDIYEFTAGMVSTITSYTVELAAPDPTA